jgi:hypothetical protein
MSASGDGGHDGELVAVADGRIEPSGEADVFVVQVVGDEGIRVTIVVDESSREGREAARDISDGFADGRA